MTISFFIFPRPCRRMSFLSFSPDWRTLVTSAFYSPRNDRGGKPRLDPNKVETQVTIEHLPTGLSARPLSVLDHLGEKNSSRFPSGS